MESTIRNTVIGYKTIKFEIDNYKNNLATLSMVSSSFENLLEHHLDFLHAKELENFTHCNNDAERHDFLLSCYSAKIALSQHTNNKNLKEIIISKGVFDQPIIYSQSTCNVHVSISNSNELGTSIAFPETHPMAIAIKKPEQVDYQKIKTGLSINEKYLARPEELTEDIYFSILETIKAALVKLLRVGHKISTNLLEISTMKYEQKFVMSYFKHFPQLKAVSFQYEGHLVSVILPEDVLVSSFL